MQTKRIVVYAASTLIAAVVTYLTIFVAFQTTLNHFSYSNTGLLFISVFGIVGIWLDYLLGTQILKS